PSRAIRKDRLAPRRFGRGSIRWGGLRAALSAWTPAGPPKGRHHPTPVIAPKVKVEMQRHFEPSSSVIWSRLGPTILLNLLICGLAGLYAFAASERVPGLRELLSRIHNRLTIAVTPIPRGDECSAPHAQLTFACCRFICQICFGISDESQSPPFTYHPTVQVF